MPHNMPFKILLKKSVPSTVSASTENRTLHSHWKKKKEATFNYK